MSKDDELKVKVNAKQNDDNTQDDAENQFPEEETPEPTESSLEQRFKEELARAMKEAQVNQDGWKRERAEFTNYKRRKEQEVKDSRQRGAESAIIKFAGLMDDFERALDNVPAELENNPWLNGISLIKNNFEKMLSDYDVEILDPVGEPFDPTRHEAISIEPSDEVESGHVSQTLQKGYISGDRVLRPALVRVAG